MWPRCRGLNHIAFSWRYLHFCPEDGVDSWGISKHNCSTLLQLNSAAAILFDAILLFKGRCDVNVKNNRNQTPLHLAIIQGHVGLVQLLVSEGSDVNAEDEDGDTAMHIALERQQLMSVLMEKREGELGSSLFSKVSWE